MQKRKKDRKSMSFFQYITKKIRLNKKVETKEKKGIDDGRVGRDYGISEQVWFLALRNAGFERLE